MFKFIKIIISKLNAMPIGSTELQKKIFERPIFKLSFNSLSLANALVGCMDKYNDKVNKGETTAHAHMRWCSQLKEQNNLADIWEDTALEQMNLLVKKEKKKKYMTIMSDCRLQNTMISRFGYLAGIPLSQLNENKTDYDDILHTIIITLDYTQALWLKHHPDPSTIRGNTFTLEFYHALEKSLKCKSMKDGLNIGVENYRSILEITWEEILRLTKDIAIEAVLGSNPKAAIKELMSYDKTNKYTVDDYWDAVLQANKPDDLERLLQDLN